MNNSISKLEDLYKREDDREASKNVFRALPSGAVYIKIKDNKVVDYISEFDRIPDGEYTIELSIGSGVNGLTETLVLDNEDFKVRHPNFLLEEKK